MNIEDWKLKDIKAECEKCNKCSNKCQLFNETTQICKLDEIFKLDEAPCTWELERGK